MSKRRFMFGRMLILALFALAVAACGAGAPDTNDATPAVATAPTPTPAAAAAEAKSWAQPPAMAIDAGAIYVATLKTEKGDITVELFADKAPLTVNNFVFLASEGFFDNTTFHRVLDGFMAQGGDPTGAGSGGPGYSFGDEIAADLSFDRAGLLAMANSGPNTNGSQFFITFAPTPWLDGGHTIFGEVIAGAEVLDLLTRRDPLDDPTTAGDVLYTVEISQSNDSRRPTPTPAPTPFAPDASADDHFMAAMPPDQRVGYWNSPPDSILQPEQVYLATFRTDVGDIVVELMPSLAPANVNNFIALARAGYYDGTHFYQVIEDLVAIGGDPLENGAGNPGYFVVDELADGVFNDVGWLGSAQSAPNSNGGQFFFTLGEAAWLAERFTPLGRVVQGAQYLASIELRDPNLPAGSAGTLLQRVDIFFADASQLPTPTPTPTPSSPTLPRQGARPLSEVAPAARNNYYNTAPGMQIDASRNYVAILRTELGDITVDLFEKQTPVTVNNFVVLALNGYYDNTTFHRVIEEFMAQAGDPTGSGAGGPGYAFADEIVNELRHDRAGLLSMANRGYDTNGSQFFITFAPTPWLDDRHTIFGEVIEGMDVVQQIALRDPDTAATPGTLLLRIDIETR